MARYKPVDRSPKFIPVVLDGQSYRTPKRTPAAASASSRRLASAAKRSRS